MIDFNEWHFPDIITSTMFGFPENEKLQFYGPSNSYEAHNILI